ncbi:hypothetical protein H0H87_006597 [Tephrocybe sp. NHM501043]|nr:hypothetical protein H0H87_006597 [Tephrocybe sp. NHM501043]
MSIRPLHTQPPFRAEHVGSFIRPSALYEKRLLYEANRCSREGLKVLEDEAIKEVVKMQRASGVKSITDGELRRGIFFEGVFNNLGGIQAVVRPIEAFKKYVPHVATFYAAGLKESPTFFCNLEYDDERSGDFLPLAHLPKNRMAVLGLVTTKRAQDQRKKLELLVATAKHIWGEQ